MEGGLYDQNPGLIDRFWYIFAERGKQEEIESKRREAEMRPKGGSRVAGRRR